VANIGQLRQTNQPRCAIGFQQLTVVMVRDGFRGFGTSAHGKRVAAGEIECNSRRNLAKEAGSVQSLLSVGAVGSPCGPISCVSAIEAVGRRV
jgi:hypothetical protein